MALFHHIGVVQNGHGDGLAGWRVQAVVVSAVQSIYSDLSSTPIVSVSGIANTAVADATGNYDFYIANGTYDLNFFDASGVFQKLVSNVPMSNAGAVGSMSISVESFGATGTPGINDQPAIQAALDYQAANGVPTVTFGHSAYELWCPLRLTPSSSPTKDGYPLIVSSSTGIELVGLASGTTLNFKNSLGGSKNVITQYTPTDHIPWQGGGMYVFDATLGTFKMRNITMDGGVTYVAANHNAGSNVNDKGLGFISLATVNNVDVRDCEFRNFSGEIFYGASQTQNVYVENLSLHDSNQSAWNPTFGFTGGGAKIVAVNLQAYNSYAPAEAISLGGHTYIGGVFGPGDTTSFTGTDFFAGGYHFSYPNRNGSGPPLGFEFIGTRFETTHVQLGAWSRGDVITVDTDLQILGNNIVSVHLNVKAWIDRLNSQDAVNVAGPPDLVTQYTGCPGGVFFKPPADIRMNVECLRTEYAKANSYLGDGVVLFNGLFDADSIQIDVSGEVNNAWRIIGTPVASYKVPQINYGPYRFNPSNQPYAGSYDAIAADTAYKVSWPALTFYPTGTGPYVVTMDTTYAYQHDQRVTFYYGSGSGKPIIFPVGGAGLALNRPYTLLNAGELLELKYDRFQSKWEVSRFTGQDSLPFTLTSGATVTPDFGKANDFELVAGVNFTLANPPNWLPGKKGTVRITQDGTGSRVASFGNLWKFPGGTPVLTTTANAVDLITYEVALSGTIYATIGKALA